MSVTAAWSFFLFWKCLLNYQPLIFIGTSGSQLWLNDKRYKNDMIIIIRDNHSKIPPLSQLTFKCADLFWYWGAMKPSSFQDFVMALGKIIL